MPNCFSLTHKLDPEAGPVALTKIDEEICRHFGVEVHYCSMWYDIIGFSLAMGRTWNQIYRQLFKMWPVYHADLARLIAIAHWLEANFTQDAWVEVGRR